MKIFFVSKRMPAWMGPQRRFGERRRTHRGLIQIEHGLGQEHDGHDVGEDAKVDVARCPRVKPPLRAAPDGMDEMPQHAKRQQYLQAKQGAQRAVEGMGQHRAVSPGHAQARGIQDYDRKRHDLPRAPPDGRFDRPHGVARNVAAYALEHQYFEEHRAHEQYRCKKMQHKQEEVVHGVLPFSIEWGGYHCSVGASHLGP